MVQLGKKIGTVIAKNNHSEKSNYHFTDVQPYKKLLWAASRRYEWSNFFQPNKSGEYRK